MQGPGEVSGTGWVLSKHSFYPLPFSCKGGALTSGKQVFTWGDQTLPGGRGGGWARLARGQEEAEKGSGLQMCIAAGLLPGSLPWAQGHPGLPLRGGGPEGRSSHFTAEWPLKPLKKWKLAPPPL